MHYWLHRKQVFASKKRESRSLGSSELQKYYSFHIVESPVFFCENCGDAVSLSNFDFAVSHQAHIIPKSIFKSVASILDNHLVLCGKGTANQCHAEYDSNWEKASRMPVMQLAIVRFTTFMHLIDANERRHLPPIFYNLLTNHHEQKENAAGNDAVSPTFIKGAMVFGTSDTL